MIVVFYISRIHHFVSIKTTKNNIKMKTVIKSILLSSVVALAACTETKKEETFNYIDERFADIQMLRYNVEGFEDLTIQQKTFRKQHCGDATYCSTKMVVTILNCVA